MNREATAEWFQYSRVLFRQQQQLQKTLVEVRATHHDVSHARIKYDTLKKKKGGEILVHVRNGDTR